MKRIWILLTALICLLAVCPAWAQNVYSSDIVTPRTGVAVCAPKKEKETIIGESVGEDLVNEIFSKFCMGK